MKLKQIPYEVRKESPKKIQKKTFKIEILGLFAVLKCPSKRTLRTLLLIGNQSGFWHTIAAHIFTMLFTIDFSNKLVFLPIAFCVWTVFGFFTTLGIAGSYDQISLPPLGWPSISSTGAYPPTSCIFSMVAVISGMLGYFVIYWKDCQ